MKRVLVSNSGDEESIAIVADEGVADIITGPGDDSTLVGNIYKGRVVNAESSCQAAFVDFGMDWEGFLHISNVHDSYGAEGESSRGIRDLLKAGQEVLVQLNKDRHRNNDFALTTHVSLPGRYVVLMPGTRKFGVSKKIIDGDERRRLRDILRDLNPPESLGYVIRTEGVNSTAAEIGADLQYLLGQWKQIVGRAKESEAPCLLYQEHGFIFRTLRERLDSDIEELVFDDKGLYERASSFVRILAPSFKGEVKLHDSSRPMLQKYGVGSRN
jgi:ribonuclease E